MPRLSMVDLFGVDSDDDFEALVANTQRQRSGQATNPRSRSHDHKLKIDITIFGRTYGFEEFLDWIQTMGPIKKQQIARGTSCYLHLVPSEEPKKTTVPS
ncbi:hypothetical protein TorRG33x02_206770 [Trema orientale]|uniref:Uncharacterized protein n=1 Tax=Trema orientale TaxID=63057 RepID=A0A2P5EDB4_TREOI|nr:hypothetical protein TorRG33x02_206770 [Trema orientale]